MKDKKKILWERITRNYFKLVVQEELNQESKILI